MLSYLYCELPHCSLGPRRSPVRALRVAKAGEAGLLEAVMTEIWSGTAGPEACCGSWEDFSMGKWKCHAPWGRCARERSVLHWRSEKLLECSVIMKKLPAESRREGEPRTHRKHNQGHVKFGGLSRSGYSDEIIQCGWTADLELVPKAVVPSRTRGESAQQDTTTTEEVSDVAPNTVTE
ncbi:hypothetical protein NDU88_002209 [Pleurodeles waltl]|uniref:Uncharacterized protein n=1 Tax=Pleurodeles waltl TaxID=8319 RepID=A0AAV7UUW8_PLEWA|nr:hypothetical protein NDU88_002209 [Pleurodeles waltl]